MTQFNLLKFDWLEENPLSGERRFVFQNNPNGGRPGEDGQAGGVNAGGAVHQQQRQEQQQEQVDEAAEQARFQEEMRHLEQLRSRGIIDADTLALASAALEGRDQHRRTAARLLARQRINGDDFNSAHECLEDGNNSEKALARTFLAGRFNSATFNEALNGIDSGDRYQGGLARRLALRQINEEEYNRARTGLDDADVDVSRASQMLAIGHMTPQEFRQELQMAERAQDPEANVEHELSPVDAQRQRTHDQITELLLQANVLIEELPERERTRPLLRMRSNLDGLNTRDTQNQRALVGLLQKINEEEEHLTERERQYIWGFTAENKSEFTAFKERLEEMDLTRAQVKQIMRLKQEEYNIETRFLAECRTFDDIMRAVGSQLTQQRREQQMIEEASKASGIKLAPGTVIQYVHPDETHGNVRTVTIRNIEPVRAPILGRNGEVVGSQPTNLRIHLDSGETYTLGRFLKWVDAADVHQNITDQNTLEQELDLHQLGLTLQSGQNLEYDSGYRVDSNGNVIPDRDSVRVVSVSDNGVELEQPVVTLTPEQAPHLGLTSPRMAREMDLGEFAKWARRNDALPNIPNLQDLRQRLQSLSTNRNNRWNRNPASYPAVRVEPGEILRFGDDDHAQFKIKKADDDNVTFADGTKMSLPAFLVWAKNNDVESHTPEAAGERAANAARNLGDEPQEQAREGAIKKFFKKLDQNNSAGDGGKSFFEKMSPYIPRNTETQGYFETLYHQTTFLSMMDLYNMGKEIIELIKRKHHRNSKNRFGGVGTNLPSVLGTEMSRIQQAAENEEVNQYKEAMDQWGTYQILDKLHTTNNKDEAKACFLTLVEKGELRWDDHEMWKTLNRLTSRFTFDGAGLYIPITDEPQPHPVTGVLTAGEDRAKEAIDALWGESTGVDWYSKNINAYNSAKSAYEYKGKQLEHDPKGTGGLPGELQRLLQEWKDGKYVNPHEYEELIDFGIKYGKMSSEQKLFFLFEGITAKAPSGPMQGMTLLHLDRIGELDGVYLNQFPMLDFFTNKSPKPLHPKFMSGEVSEPPKGGYKIEDYERFRDDYFKEESDKGMADKKFSRFLWEWMIVDPNFRKRLSKGLRRAENMDHDDAHLFIPPATMEEIEKFTGTQSGSQLFFTLEGYKNGYAGYNQYIISLSNRREDLERLIAEQRAAGRKKAVEKLEEALKENSEQMVGALQGYFLFDAYLSGRKDQRNTRRARLDKMHFNDQCVIDDSCKLSVHKGQLDSLVQGVCDAYGIDHQSAMLYDEAGYADRTKQEQIAANMDEFLKKNLPDILQRDGGKKLFQIVQNRKNAATTNPTGENTLRGIASSNRLIG